MTCIEAQIGLLSLLPTRIKPSEVMNGDSESNELDLLTVSSLDNALYSLGNELVCIALHISFKAKSISSCDMKIVGLSGLDES